MGLIIIFMFLFLLFMPACIIYEVYEELIKNKLHVKLEKLIYCEYGLPGSRYHYEVLKREIELGIIKTSKQLEIRFSELINK